MSDLNELLTMHVAGNSESGTEKKAEETKVEPVTAETVVVKAEEPKAETSEEKKVEPTFDESKYLPEISGGKWKSKDEVQTFLSEHETLNKKYSELESAQKEYIKPASDFVKKLNEIAANGGDTNLFIQTNGIDIDKLSDAQAVALKLQWDKKYNPEDATYKVNRQYLLNKKEATNEIGEVVPFTEEEKDEIRFQQIELRNDAQSARDYLKGVQVKAAEVPDIGKEDRERVSQWTPNVPKVLHEAGKLTAKLNIGTKESPEELDFDFTLDTEQQKVMAEMLNTTIKSAKQFSYDSESHEYAKKMVEKWAWGEFRNEIVNAISQKIDSHKEEKYRKLTGATTKEKVDTPIKTEAKSPQAALLDHLS